MLRKLFVFMMAVFAMVMGMAPAFAGFGGFENVVPDEPVETENERVHVSATYDVKAGRTCYTIALKDAAVFADGRPVTAEDLLFSLYVWLDPGYRGEGIADGPVVAGAESYQLQMSAGHLAEALEILEGIRQAGPEHVWSENDGWTKEQQEIYRTLTAEYDAACASEYSGCAQAIVDDCARLLVAETQVFGMPVEDVLENPGLLVAHAMVERGYAVCDDDVTLLTNRTRTVWRMDNGIYPTVEDFVAELRTVYGNDLGKCWSMEGVSGYEPGLPDVRWAFLEALSAQSDDVVTCIEGIRVVDERTMEIMLEGVDMRSAALLLGVPVLSLEAYGSVELWDPEAGLYGHPLGDTAAIESAVEADGGAHTLQLMERVMDSMYF